MKFTVLLLRPEHIADVFGEDTYLTYVEAEDASRAVALAQQEAYEEDRDTDYEDDSDPGNASLLDYHPLAVFAGFLDDIKP